MDRGGRLGRTLRAWPGRIAGAIALLRAGGAARRRHQPVLAIPRGTGSGFALLFLLLCLFLGLHHGGHLEKFRREHGTLHDALARAMGFGIGHIAVAGHAELTRDEVIALSGVTPNDSLPFLEPREVQARLMQVPLIREAAVRKLYPDRLTVEIKERVPYAIWQLDGEVQVIAADGTPIENFADPRFLRLPHVVGRDANLRVKEFAALLTEVPGLAPQIRAGTLVAGRRWTLKLANGVDVKLPEQNPERALRTFARLEAEAKLSERGLLSIDLRIPDRVIVRLTEEAAAQHAETAAARIKKAGGRG